MKSQKSNLKGKIHIYKLSAFFLTVITFYLFFITYCSAQSLSLSVTPPVSEILIKPGTEFVQRFLITNNQAPTLVKAYIQPFKPLDSKGNVALVKEVPKVSLDEALSWFTFEKPNINAGESFSLSKGMTQDVSLKIAIPAKTPEGDYYFTLLFETQNPPGIGGTTTTSKAIVGTNILITVTQNELTTKLAKINTFEAPFFMDSLSNLDFKITVSNVGQSFFKPIGEITVKPLIGKKTVLKLAPQNILSDSKRDLLCIDDKKLIPCSIKDRFFLGIYKEKLRFTLDDSPKVYEENAVTIAVPYTLGGAGIILFIFYRIIKTNLKTKKNNNSDKTK